MSKREELSDEMLEGVDGGLRSAGEYLNDAKKLVSDYVDNRMLSAKIPLGVLGEVKLETVKETAEKIMDMINPSETDEKKA